MTFVLSPLHVDKIDHDDSPISQEALSVISFTAADLITMLLIQSAGLVIPAIRRREGPPVCSMILLLHGADQICQKTGF
jgi:hypothetical protein